MEAAEDIVELLKPAAIKKNVSLKVEFDADKTKYYMGDPIRVRQILTNLIGNAIKFTHQGHVKVSVKSEEIEERGKITVSIEDTGIGIPADKVNQLFEKFSQVGETMTSKYGGTGLGLAISRSLIEAMGGEIHVASVEGEGSTFWFTLVLEPASSQPALVA